MNIIFIQYLTGCSTIMAASLVDESNVQALLQPLTVGQLEEKYGKWQQGHGPYVWYKSTNEKNEMWFWYLPKKDAPTKKYEVALITKVDANDTDKITILWPKKFRGMKFQEVYKSIYKGYENEEHQ